MSGYILCQTKKARSPYFIQNISTNIYTLEELCYYLYHNIYLVDQTIINEALCSWIAQELELPSAPKQFIQYLEEDNRPQVTEDVNFENGMGVSIGRLREDTVYDWKFIGLSHNTVRGAAGGAVLCAETLKAQGYIQAK